jgi:hypothetical protein
MLQANILNSMYQLWVPGADNVGDLTLTRRKISEFPMGPSMAKMLITSVDCRLLRQPPYFLGCTPQKAKDCARPICVRDVGCLVITSSCLLVRFLFSVSLFPLLNEYLRDALISSPICLQCTNPNVSSAVPSKKPKTVHSQFAYATRAVW